MLTALRDYERGFMNVLESIRKPVYDMIHTGCNVEVTWRMLDVDDYPGRTCCADGDCGESDCNSDGDSDTKSEEGCGCSEYDVCSLYKDRKLDLFRLSKEEWETVHTFLNLILTIHQSTTNSPFFLVGKSHTRLPLRSLQP